MRGQQFQDKHLLDYWDIILKRKNIALAVALVVTGVLVLYTMIATPVYRGTSQILFELKSNPTMNFVDGEGAFIQKGDSKAYFRTQLEILKSRSFGDRVVRKLALDKNVYFLKKKDNLNNVFVRTVKWFKGLWVGGSGEYDPFPDFVTSGEVDRVLTDIVLEGMIVTAGKHNILKIHYESDNPKVSAVLANGIAKSYIEHNLEIRVKPFRDAVEWLSSKMVELRSRVEDSERSLQVYKEGEGVVSFEAKGNVVNQELSELVSQLVRVESKRQDAQIRFNQIKSVIDSPSQLVVVPEIMNNIVVQEIRKEELALKQKISELSDKFGPKHPQMIQVHSELELVQKNLLIEARKMLNSVKTEYEVALSREESLNKKIDQQKLKVLDLSRKAIEFNVVAGESLSNKQFYEILLNKLQEASLSSGINVSNAQVVDFAIIPESPIRPNKLYNLIVAIFLGFFAGLASVFIVEYMDDTLKNADDVNERLGLPFLGYIPATGSEKGALCLLEDPKSMAAEAYRSLRTSIMLSSPDNNSKVLLVTSSTPGEGKTTTASNLAVAMAQTGEKVLLVDTDLRRKTIHKVFNIEDKYGITDIILGDGAALKHINKIEGVDSLDIITGGLFVPNPTELLSSNRMESVIEDLRGKYDRIILDSPPLMAVSDPLILSHLVDGVVMVVWGGVTSRKIATQSALSLLNVTQNIMGVVLNNIEVGKSEGYQYYPYYSEENAEDSKPIVT